MFNNYINLFSGVAFLYQRFWNTGKKNYLFNGRANPNEETSKIKKKKKKNLFTEKVARKPRNHLAKYFPSEDKRLSLVTCFSLQNCVYLL